MKTIRYITIFLAAFLGSMLGMIMLLPFGLIIRESIILPVTMLVAAIPAALAAGWVGGQRGRLKAILLSVGKTAVFLAIFQLLNITFLWITFSPLIWLAVAASAVLAISSIIATMRHRQQSDPFKQSIKSMLLLLAFVPVLLLVSACALLAPRPIAVASPPTLIAPVQITATQITAVSTATPDPIPTVEPTHIATIPTPTLAQPVSTPVFTPPTLFIGNSSTIPDEDNTCVVAHPATNNGIQMFVYSGPDHTFEIVAELAPNHWVSIAEAQSGWYRIVDTAENGGWVHQMEVAFAGRCSAPGSGPDLPLLENS